MFTVFSLLENKLLCKKTKRILKYFSEGTVGLISTEPNRLLSTIDSNVEYSQYSCQKL